MSVLENVNFDDHEAVHVFSDPASGLRCIIAVHSTHRGPSAGGARLWHYENSELAITDALRLSRGMSYKNAMAGLNLGGGKTVILKPEGEFDRKALFTALGRAVEQIGGRYYTAEDVGVSPDDMRNVRTQTRYVGGLDDGDSASGDPSPVTADGVFRCLQLAADRKLNANLKGITVGVQGLGHVGFDVCRRLHAVGAKLLVSDINTDRVSQTISMFGARAVAPDEFYNTKMDLYSPCALGATINLDTIEKLQCVAIAGAANNQLKTRDMGHALLERGILYCPDYIVNGGGIINIAGEIEGNYNKEWVEDKICGLVETLDQVLDTAEQENLAPHVIADKMAQERIGRA